MDHHENHHHHHDTASSDAIPPEIQAVCPVTGDLIDIVETEKLGYVREHDGKKIYFCCATCVQLFDENPTKYIAHRDSTAHLKLIDKQNLVDNIWSFQFEPSEPLTWTPGQFMRVELIHENPDAEGPKRWFTISSAPYEKIIQITTRVTNSTFKQALSRLSIGQQLTMTEKPDGDFVWEESSRPLIFIAGGIGITPFYSILKQRANDHMPLSVMFIYGGRDQNIPFKEEIDKWSNENTEFKTQYFIGQPLTINKVAEVYPEIYASIVYISGPETMVEALGEELKSSGLPKDQLRQDFFPNYNQENY